MGPVAVEGSDRNQEGWQLTERLLDSDKAFNALVRYGEDWADKDAAANVLEKNKDSVLAKFKNKVDAKSDAAKETQALCNPEYRAYLDSMVEARRVANRAKVKYDSAKTLSELRRSEEATRRAEMTLR